MERPDHDTEHSETAGMPGTRRELFAKGAVLVATAVVAAPFATA